MRQETIGDYKGSGSTLLTSNQMRTLGRLDGAAQYGVAVLFPLKVNVGAGVDQHFNDIGSPLPCRHIQGRAPIEPGLWKKLVISGARASGGVTTTTIISTHQHLSKGLTPNTSAHLRTRNGSAPWAMSSAITSVLPWEAARKTAVVPFSPEIAVSAGRAQ